MTSRATPALAHISPDNPLTRFSDQSAVVGLLASVLSNDAQRRALAQNGADPQYTVAPTQSAFGYSSQMLEITGVASSGPGAIKTAQVVGNALDAELERLQASRGVAPYYRIKAELITPADTAQQRVSGKLRSLIGVLVMGIVLLFVVISAAEGLAIVRQRRGHGAVPPAPGVEPSIEDTSPNGESNGSNGAAIRSNGSSQRKRRRKGRRPSRRA